MPQRLMGLSKDRVQEPGVTEDPFSRQLVCSSPVRAVSGGLRVDVLWGTGAPVNSTVPLDKPFHRSCPEVGHFSGLPDCVLADVTSYRSLRVRGFRVVRGDPPESDTIDGLDLPRPDRMDTLPWSD